MPALGRSRARRPTDRACVMLLADGARADLFERLLEEGQLPNIARHVVERGDYRRASTVFTSTTGPAHVPFLTGMFPGTADIPGIRWFDRRKYRPDLGGGALRMRSYVGAEAGLVNADLNPRAHALRAVREPAQHLRLRDPWPAQARRHRGRSQALALAPRALLRRLHPGRRRGRPSG